MAAEALRQMTRMVWVAAATAALGCGEGALQPDREPPTMTLAFTVQPSIVSANQPITPAIQVRIQDAAGNPLQGQAGTVTIALGSNPTGGRLSGTTTQTLFHGMATFGDLSIDRAGSGYTLVALTSGVTAVMSAPFDVQCRTNCWTANAPMPAPLSFSGTGVLEGILYAVGGLSRSGKTGTMEAYDPATNAWSRRASLSFPRSGLAVAALDGVLYAIGGT